MSSYSGQLWLFQKPSDVIFLYTVKSAPIILKGVTKQYDNKINRYVEKYTLCKYTVGSHRLFLIYDVNIIILHVCRSLGGNSAGDQIQVSTEPYSLDG